MTVQSTSSKFANVLNELVSAAMFADCVLAQAAKNPSNDAKNRSVYASTRRSLTAAIKAALPYTQGDDAPPVDKVVDGFYGLLASSELAYYALTKVSDEASKKEMLRAIRYAAHVLEEDIQEAQTIQRIAARMLDEAMPVDQEVLENQKEGGS